MFCIFISLVGALSYHMFSAPHTKTVVRNEQTTSMEMAIKRVDALVIPKKIKNREILHSNFI
jgi:hypothetical protein